jgi:hypothetical protein
MVHDLKKNNKILSPFIQTQFVVQPENSFKLIAVILLVIEIMRMYTKGRFLYNVIKCRKMSHNERVQEKGANETHPKKGKKK